MSTKTSIKRIALIVAAAVTLGGVSIITAESASATVLTPTAYYTTMYDTTNGYQVVNGQATLTLGLDSGTISTVTTSGVGSILSYTATNNGGGTETLTAVTGGFQYNWNMARQAVVGAAGRADTVTVVLTSAVTGTQTITIQPLNSDGTPGTAVTKVVTWTSSGSTAVAAIDAYVIDTTTGITSTAGLVDSTVPLSYDKGTVGSASSQKAEVVFKVKDGNGNAVSSAVATIIVSGPGLLRAAATASPADFGSGTAPAYRATTVTTDATGYASTIIGNDGNAGVATVTISISGSTITASKSVTFTGSAATITPTSAVGSYAVGVNGANASGGSANDSSSAYAIKALVKDSAGGLVTAGSIWAKSSNTAVATVSSSAHTPSKGYVYIIVTGVSVGKSTITFQNTDPAGTTAPTVTGTVDINVTAALAKTVTLATDKTSYQAGEPGTLTVTLKNADGTPVADGTYSVFAAATPLASNLYIQGNAGGANASAWSTGITSVTTTGGVASYDFFAPSVGGTLTFSATTIAATTASNNLTADARSVALSTSATVSNGSSGGDAALALDAANAATDAANNAYDEAQNATQAAQDALAAVTALAKQVSSLIASVKSLTALVSKIKAKVGA